MPINGIVDYWATHESEVHEFEIGLDAVGRWAGGRATVAFNVLFNGEQLVLSQTIVLQPTDADRAASDGKETFPGERLISVVASGIRQTMNLLFDERRGEFRVVVTASVSSLHVAVYADNTTQNPLSAFELDVRAGAVSEGLADSVVLKPLTLGWEVRTN